MQISISKFLMLVVMLIVGSVTHASEPGTLIKIPYPPPIVIDDDEEGQRQPGRHFSWSVDFENQEIYIDGFDTNDIETFEICDAESHVCVYGTDDCAEFVGELAQIHDTVYVIFHFDVFTLSGYFAR